LESSVPWRLARPSGPVNTEVTLRIVKGGEIVSVITTQSARRLKLKQAGKAHALIKADSVILAVD